MRESSEARSFRTISTITIGSEPLQPALEPAVIPRPGQRITLVCF
jgi:hypothetical protein